MRRLRKCIAECFEAYSVSLDVKTCTILVGCILTAVAMGDFTMTSAAICLAAGGVADVTVGLSACLVNCMKPRH